jgi:hypothetical protein
MGRTERVRAASRKLAENAAAARMSDADRVGLGVRQVARDLASAVIDGTLWWMAPLTYVAEQAAPRVCRQHGIDPARAEDVAAYLLNGLSELLVAMVGEFDVEHFERAVAGDAAGEQSQRQVGDDDGRGDDDA